MFLNKRRKIDHKLFKNYSNDSSKTIEILSGVIDIKLSNAILQKRGEWESIQQKLYKVKIKSLTISQLQEIGSGFIVQIANIVITFLAAKSVINGDLSLGAMFAITMIVGQITSPMAEIRAFISIFQDAKLGLERIYDVKSKGK